MRRRSSSKFTLEPKNIALICGVFCVIMIIVSFKFENQMRPVKTTVGSVFAPMQKGINYVGKAVFNKVNVFSNMKKLRAENDKLTEQLNKIKGENRLLLQDKSELESLRSLYSLDSKYKDLPKVAARVTSKDPTNWYSTFTINKGSNDGIKVNMNVIADNGLVGIVSEAGHNYAKVRTIIDDKSNVTSVFLKSTEICNVAGDLKTIADGKIRVEAIAKDVEVKEGDAVYTAYDSPKFHQGILIGYVSDIKIDSNNVTKSGLLTPVVNFKDLDTVLVITELNKGLY